MGMTITPFTWADWRALWQVRRLQLAEDGILVDLADIGDRPSPEDDDTYEWDFYHLEQVYLSGAGGFWLARRSGDPVGYVGAQDMGGVVELRHMYVAAEYRRQGIGRSVSRMVSTASIPFIAHRPTHGHRSSR